MSVEQVSARLLTINRRDCLSGVEGGASVKSLPHPLVRRLPCRSLTRLHDGQADLLVLEWLFLGARLGRWLARFACHGAISIVLMVALLEARPPGMRTEKGR